ncbi:DUF6461 domain-containing protein [Spirillospora sp. NPDC029432]|uniref:DUF6461 domain-containing protein n=1 Tax=Spirillospora sp. NPDC029432 TaxID=3154599 RepID=UPI00345721A7
MAPTAADYAWFDERFPDLAEAYCFTLVRGLTPAQVLARLGARTGGPQVKGVEALSRLSYDTYPERAGNELVVGVTPVGGWALAVEPNGYIGVSEEAAVPLSAGSRLVSHSTNVNAVGNFFWVEDGDVRLTFEPLFPSSRWGGTPDALLGEMREAGFDLQDGDDANLDCGAAAFALAERLTGVRITPEILTDSTFLCGLAPVP